MEPKSWNPETFTDAKPWFLSKAIIGNVMAVIALVLGALFGIKIDPTTSAWLVDQAVALISAAMTFLSILFSIYGRVVAKQPIGTRADDAPAERPADPAPEPDAGG